uniref:Uncharacterized protein n=1 Tax=Panagrolaimus sp. PS1159 TaxID=55785 RepID=A0AC35GXG1_9BILA
MNKQMSDLFYNIIPFAKILIFNIIVETNLIHSHNNLVGKISDIRNAAMALGGTGIIDDEIRKCENLVEQLLELREPAIDIDKKIEEPLPYIEHMIHDDLLLPKLNNVQTMLDKKRRSLENRAIVETLAPQIKLITANLKQNLDDYETIFTKDLKHQQRSFNDFTQQRHKFEEYNKKIPEGPEGNEIRKIIQENLSRHSNILEKLENVISKEAAAHALFISSKCALEKELSFLNSDITTIESDIDDATLNTLQEQLNPCEMPNRDFKSIVTDWEQTNECFENNPIIYSMKLMKSVE